MVDLEFEKFCEKKIHQTLEAQERVAIACSGGADSMCLLYLMLKKFPEYKNSIVVLHFNHKVRANADIDEIFVKDECKKLGVEYFSSVPRKKIEKLSESSLRNARLDFFEYAAKKFNLNIILQAHHCDDVAETILMRIARGSGLDGLCVPKAISEYKGICFVRPLIEVTKDSIKQYLKSIGVSWREDESNAETDFTRNKIRNLIIPTINKVLDKNLSIGASRTRKLLEEDSIFIDNILKKELSNTNHRQSQKLFDNSNPPNFIALNSIIVTSPALLRRSIQLFLSANNLSDNARASNIDTFIYKISTTKNDVSTQVGDKTLHYISSNNSLELTDTNDDFNYSVELSFGKNTLPSGDVLRVRKLSFFYDEEIEAHFENKSDSKILDSKESFFYNLKNNNNSKKVFLDISALGNLQNNKLIARTAIPKDSYTPYGLRSPKLIKDLFSSKKLSLLKRKTNPLVCNLQGEILWSPSLPPSAKYPCSYINSHRLLELTFYDKIDLLSGFNNE